MTAGVCRVCLVSDADVKIFNIDDNRLGDIFERLTSNKWCERDMPRTVCCLCLARLQRCRRLADVARNSQTLLTCILRQGKEISNKSIAELNLRASHRFSTSVIDLISVDSESNLNLTLDGRYTVKQETEDIKEEIIQYESKVTRESKREKYRSKVSECEDQQSLNSKLLKNITNKNKVEKYQCSDCNKSFYRKANLQKHKQTHTRDKLFVCEHCNKKFKQRSHLNVHLRIHTGEKLFACEICGKTFNQIANLNKHRSIHIGIKPFSCDICSKTFLQRAQVKAHLRTHTGEKPYICNICNKGFSHAVPLRKHTKLHINPKPFVCSECFISFDVETQLSDHLKVHSERGFKCCKCKSAFKDRRSLSRHDLQVHCEERQHVCPRCNKAFKRSQHLSKHMTSAHCKPVYLDT